MKKTIYCILLILILSAQLSAQEDMEVKYLSPSSGGAGTVVAIYGKNLGSTPGKAWFGSIPAEILSWTEEKAEIVVPSDVKPTDLKETGRRKRLVLPVVIETATGAKSEIKAFDILPRIKRISPNHGSPGLEIEIKGTNFGDYIDWGKAYVGSTPVKIKQWTSNKILVILPDSVKPYELKLDRRKNNTVDLVVQAGKLRSKPRQLKWEPELHGFSPYHGGAGTSVQIKGKGFGRIKSSVKVLFGQAEAEIISVKNDRIGVKVPGNIKPANLKDNSIPVKVFSGGVYSKEKLFNVQPRIFSLAPYQSRGGILAIVGYNLGTNSEGNQVFIKSQKNSSFLKPGIISWKDGKIEFQIPSDINKTDENIRYEIWVKLGNLESNKREYIYLKSR
ncbi:MAG: IPT/TIG domain-containing protein [Vulcanimicrobiota bacterium]